MRDPLLQLLALAHIALAGAFIVDLLRQHRSPAATIAWVTVLVLLPYAGLALYVVAGAPRKRTAALADYLAQHVHAPPADATAFCADTERLLRALGLPGATLGNEVRLCDRNEDAAEALLALIRSARRRLLLSVFSFEADEAGRRLIQAMTERAAAGVEVRMLVDGYGSIELGRSALQALERAGGRIARHRPLVAGGTLRGAFNYRNHRKMVIADGRSAWVGGRNLARKYLATQPDGRHWRDLSLVVSGPAAAVFESVFRSDWLAASGETLPGTTETDALAASSPLATGGEAPAADARAGSAVQVLAAGPDLADDTLHASLLAGISGARQRVWIASPFFVPDDALQSALRLACRRGLDVCIVVPRRSNLRLADYVRTSYLAELAAAGARVLLFEPAVLHAKIVVLDERVALVGSANFDMRSLFTNHEVAAVLYTRADVDGVAAIVGQYAAEATEDARPRRFAATAIGGALRVIAPLL
jgi:cardiolipin synthase